MSREWLCVLCVSAVYATRKKNIVSFKPFPISVSLSSPPFCTSPSNTHNRAPDREEIGIFIITHGRYLRKKRQEEKKQTILRTTQRAPSEIKTRGIQVTVYREKVAAV